VALAGYGSDGARYDAHVRAYHAPVTVVQRRMRDFATARVRAEYCRFHTLARLSQRFGGWCTGTGPAVHRRWANERSVLQTIIVLSVLAAQGCFPRRISLAPCCAMCGPARCT
jgi:hypothetical protein